MTAVAAIIALGGLVIFFVSQPLIRRKVPMNGLYGIRIPAAFKSEQRWYEINAYGGRQMAAWSWMITGAGVAGFLVPAAFQTAYFWAIIPVALLAVLVPVVRICRWAGRKAG
ncbi:MAG: SdpI family protein [Verrucomicrobiota bacterium]